MWQWPQLRKVRRHSRRRDQRFGRRKLETSPGTNVRGSWQAGQIEPTIVLAADPEERDGWTQQVVDWTKKRPGAKSGHLYESQKVSETRIKELANVEKLEVAKITLQEARAQGSEIDYVGWLDDAARGTPVDPDAVRSTMDATQVNTNDGEHVVQATLPIKAFSIILSSAATKPNAKDQHW